VTPEVIDWYERKTSFVLDQYGPGPRVHYHTGLVGPSEPAAADAHAVSQQLVRAQERMLDHACAAWNADEHLRGELLDVGCGLGGSCLYFAERFGARVTGLTPIPSHVPIVDRFAREAGVGSLVAATLGDAHTFPGEARFDAAFSFGASNYFDRAVWFRRLAGLVRSRGQVCIEDTFLVRPEMAAAFNAYWISNIGTREEYVAAAEAAGFELMRLDDVTSEAAGFWRLSVAHSRLLLESETLTPAEVEARRRSIDWQSRFYSAYLDRGVENLLLRFRKRA
jgi:tocopherol O-methyltransferase